MEQWIISVASDEAASQAVAWFSSIATLGVALVAVWAARHGSRTAYKLQRLDAEERAAEFDRRRQHFVMILRHEVERLGAAAALTKQTLEESVRTSRQRSIEHIGNPLLSVKKGISITAPNLVERPEVWLEYVDDEIIGDITNVSIAYQYLEDCVREYAPRTRPRVDIDQAERLVAPLERLHKGCMYASSNLQKRLSD